MKIRVYGGYRGQGDEVLEVREVTEKLKKRRDGGKEVEGGIYQNVLPGPLYLRPSV
jgi:hypothetical protein